jgi:hypothetical protein
MAALAMNFKCVASIANVNLWIMVLEKTKANECVIAVSQSGHLPEA